MGVEKPDLFKQWKMMQNIDRILAEVAAHAAAAGLVLESVREVLLAKDCRLLCPTLVVHHRRSENKSITHA